MSCSSVGTVVSSFGGAAGVPPETVQRGLGGKGLKAQRGQDKDTHVGVSKIQTKMVGISGGGDEEIGDHSERGGIKTEFRGLER